jgi:hypothetical protein
MAFSFLRFEKMKSISVVVKSMSSLEIAELTGKDITPAMAAEVVKRHLGEISKVQL